MLDQLNPPETSSYRNPRFQKTIIILNMFAPAILHGVAAAALIRTIGYITTFVVLSLYHLLLQANQSTIYFFDNKGIGPTWKDILLEDCALAVRSSAIASISGWIILKIAIMMQIVS